MIGGCRRAGTTPGNHIKTPNGCIWEVSGDFLTLTQPVYVSCEMNHI